MISFITPGLIDPRCITTIGVSVKEGSNPIGFFGTGLKYAIAIILRERGEITIWSGGKPYKFSARPTIIRGKEIFLVYMNEQELSFTIDLGKQWKVWQAFRELYCNTLDERGVIEEGNKQPDGMHTTIHVELPEFDACFAARGMYFLQDAPVYSSVNADFHTGGTSGIYYRGVRVADSVGEAPMRFRVNVKDSLFLTEDRTVRSTYEVIRAISHALYRCTDSEFIEDWLTSGRNYEEGRLDLDWPGLEPSKEFLNVASALMRDPSRQMNVSVLRVVLRYVEPPEPTPCELLGSEKYELKRAIEFCKQLGFQVDEFPISVVESLGENVLGTAMTASRKVLLSRKALNAGDSTLSGTLIEEWAHIKHGLLDCDRGMQNWLLDNLIRLGKAYLFEVKS